MGAFSRIDVALSEMSQGRGREKPDIGGFGVCLNDPGNPPIFWTLETVIGGVGVFRQSDNPANIAQFPIDDFWRLI